LERLWVLGIDSVFGERKRERKEGGRRRRYGGDVGREDREFYDIIFGKKEGGRREEKKEREDRIKSAMRILRFCCDKTGSREAA
jgi:hypothetical protein